MSSSNVHPNGRERELSENSQASIEQQLAQCQASCRQMEATLQATVAQLERSLALYNNLPSIYFTLNFTGVISSINSLGAERLGYTAEELIGRSIFSLVNVTTRSQFQDAFSAWMQQSTLAGNWQGEFLRSDGTLVWVNAIARRSADPSNPEIFLVGEEIANFANQALYDREQRFRRIFERAAVGIVQTAISGQYLLVNQKFADILQYTVEELQEKTFQEITEPDDINSDRHQISRLLAGEISGFSIEKRYIRKNGSRIWVNLNRSVIRNSAGEPQYFIGVIEDISERKAAEEALRESEQRLAAIADNVPGVFYRLIVRNNGRFSMPYVSAGLQDLIGIAAGEIIAHPSQIFKQIHPDDRQNLKKAIKFSAQTLARFRYEYRVISKSGPIKWVRAIARVYRSHSRQIVFDGLVLDITARKVAEEALQEMQAQNRALIAAIPDMMFRVREDGTYLDYISSLQVEPLLPPSAFLGKKVQDILPKPIAEVLTIARMQALKTGQTQVVEFQGSQQGRLIDYEARMAFLNPHEVLSIVRDITPRKQAERALQQQIQRTQLILQTTLDGFLTVTLEGKIIEVNPAFCAMMGYSRSELLTLHISDLDANESLEKTLRHIEKIEQTGSDRFETKHRRKYGQIVDVEITTSLAQIGENRVFFNFCRDITDRKLSEEALRRSESRYRAIIEDQTELICRFMPDGTITFINEAFCRYFELIAEEWIGKRYEPLIVEEDRELVAHCLDNLTLKNPVVTVEHRVVVAGEIRWMQWINRAIFDPAGNFIEFQSVGRDISDRKRAEKALRDRESQLAEAQQIAHLGSWEFDVQTQTITWSEELFRIFGLDPTQPEPTLSEHLELVYPDDRALCLENIQQITIDGKSQEYEHRIIRPNGQIRYISGQRKATLDDCNRVIRVFGTAQDITERKLAEIERDRFFNLPLDLLAIAGFDGYFKRVNPAVTTILGYTEEEFLSRPFIEFIHPEDRDRTREEIAQKLLTGETTLYFENRYLCKNGSYKWLSWTAFPVIAEGLTYTVARDTTERKSAEIALRESREKYRILFEIFPIGLGITDETGNTIDVNPAAEKILGISKEKQLTIKADSPEWQVIRADKTPMPSAEYPSVIGLTENRLIENVEIGFVKQDEQIIWLSVTVAPIPLEGYGVAIAYTDITARKQIEEALRLSEKQFRTLAEHTPDIIARFDSQQRHLYVNPAIERATGLSAESFIGKTHRDLGMPEDRIVQWESARQQVLEYGDETVIEFNFLSPNGIRYYQARMVPEFTTEEGSGNEQVESILSIARDITDLKQMQQWLQVARARLQYLLAKSPAVIYSCKSSGDYGATFVSENIAQIVGYEVRDFLVDSSFWINHIHPDDRDRILADLLEIFETSHHVCEYQFQHQNGSYRWIYDERHLVRDEDDNPLEIVGSWIDITDRKLAEEQLLRFSKAVASARDGIGMTDMTGQSTYHNQAFLQMFGYTPEQINADGGWQVIFTDEAIARQVFDTILQGDSWSGEVQMRNRQGRVLDILLRAYAIEDNSENPIGLVSIYTDITERKRSLMLLQEREIRFRTLAETVTAAIFIFQGNRLRYVNSAAEVLTGYTREQLLIGGAQLIHPQFLEFAANQIDEDSASLPYLQQQGQQRAPRCEFKLLTKTRQERWVDFSVALMEYNGQPAVLSAAFDITDRKQAEESLKYRVQLEQLIGHISSKFLHLNPDKIDTGINEILKKIGAFMEVDRTYLYIFTDNQTKIDRSHQWVAPGIEPKILELSNLPLNTLTAQTVRKDETVDAEDVRSPDVQATILVPLAVGGSTVGAIGCDTVLAPKIWTEDHISLLRIVGEMFVTAMERRRFERELQERAAELVRSNAELEQFAYIASHDLQEPLRTVMSYTQLLARRYSGQLDAKAERYMNFTVEGASRMQRLIEDLLAYSRVGTRAREFQSVDCVTAFEQALANLRMAIQESGAIITRNDLPTIQGDPTQFAQLLQNLIGNAIKYRGTEPPQIRVSAELLDNQWQFSISDNGIGIEAKHSDRIFQVFQRLHTREEYPGTGIGLAICKKIVERHGGRISLDSLPGEGSTFYFTIPNT